MGEQNVINRQVDLKRKINKFCIKIKVYQYNLIKTIIDTLFSFHYNIKYYSDTVMILWVVKFNVYVLSQTLKANNLCKVL